MIQQYIIGRHHVLGLERKSLRYLDPEALWTKIKNLTTLFSHKRELYTSKEVKENAVESEGKSWRPEIQKPQKINKRVMTSP